MKIFLTNQNKLFPAHLKELSTYKVIPYNKETLKYKTNSKRIESVLSINTINLKDFFNYKIFPINILQAYTQWEHEGRDMQINDTIVQQIQIPPIMGFSLKIITGVRIKEVINIKNQKGFSYETLQGHVEKGVSTFIIEQHNNSLTFTIETYSSSNGVILSIFQPFLSLYQDYCTQQALNFLESQLSSSPKPII
ncbi:MAG: DUF1990 domain-containing protein [Candidatus Calescibacterium sp.]|nr:DUF1990 domain-containing protein [Candidatus Calescibacterium sp.]